MGDLLEQRHVLVLRIMEHGGHGSLGTYRALPDSIAERVAL